MPWRLCRVYPQVGESFPAPLPVLRISCIRAAGGASCGEFMLSPAAKENNVDCKRRRDASDGTDRNPELQARLLVWLLWEAPRHLAQGAAGASTEAGPSGAGQCAAYPAWLAALYFILYAGAHGACPVALGARRRRFAASPFSFLDGACGACLLPLLSGRAGAVGTIARMYRVLIDLCAALSPEWRRDQARFLSERRLSQMDMPSERNSACSIVEAATERNGSCA